MKSIIKILFLNMLFVTTLVAQEEEFGLASYYSDLFQGKPTASGELYSKTKLTGAHKTFPFGSSVKVTRLDNNKSVIVKINDRGPFISGRVIELSKAAADQIGLLNDGSAKVKLELVKGTTESDAASIAKTEDQPKPYDANTPPPPATTTTEAKTTPAPVEKPKTEPAKATDQKPAKAATDDKVLAVNQKPTADTKAKDAKVTNTTANTADAPKARLVTGQDFQSFDLFQIELKRPEKKGFGVQVAALSNQDALFKKIAELQGDWFSTILVSVQQGTTKDEVLYKVILGTFATRGDAEVYQNNLKKKNKLEGFVVDLATLNQ